MELVKSTKEKEVYSYLNNKGEKLWMFRHKYHDGLTGKRKEKKKSGFKTEKAAIQALLEVKAQTLRGETKLIENDNITISQWLDAWLEMNKNKWKVTTMKQRELTVKNHLKPLLGHFKLQKLDRITYQKVFIDKIEQKLKPGTVNLFHSIFKIAINAAVEEELLARNRFTKVVIKNEAELTKETNNFLTIVELNEFLEVAKRYENITNYTFLLVAVYTGMRKGEACGLQWQNIDFKNNTITIERTRDEKGTRTPKTKNSYRKILVDNLVIDQLKKYQIWCKQILLKHGKSFDDQLFIFITEFNNPIHGMAIHKLFRDTMFKAGILNDDGEPKITFHGLRHTHATILLNGGQNVKVIAERLGNTPAMIYQIYGHVMKELEEQTMEVFSKSLETGTGAKSGAN
ncbi:tyrosine-type recombinase/integrase [Lysinibacillus xylanilyticus]|uniref:site-specific integrase n=1 Tax=Lysinibacillus xylanilyticus TaxID=582475 RepID=UPI003F69AA08